MTESNTESNSNSDTDSMTDLDTESEMEYALVQDSKSADNLDLTTCVLLSSEFTVHFLQ